MKLIDKENVIEYILKRKSEIYDEYGGIVTTQRGLVEYKVLQEMQSFLNTLEVKEVDLGEELSKYIEHYRNRETGYTIFGVAEHFFELGIKVNNPITATDRGMAEEIIINLKRIEQDYCIDLNKEMHWLMDIVNKRE